MANKSLSKAYKNAVISIEEDRIYEYKTKGNQTTILTHVLSDLIKEFAGDEKRVDITFKESSEIEPIDE